MPLTFGEFKDIVYPYAGRAGKCVDSPEVTRFARQVMEYLLFSGSTAAIRRLTVMAYKGAVTLPPEVEVPLKAKINGQRANIWNQWYSMGASDGNLEQCADAFTVMADTGEQTPLAYDIPAPFSLLGVMGTCVEEPDTTLIIQGKDSNGRELYSSWRGEKVTGEKFSIEKDTVRYGKLPFAEVTGVVKPKTNGYVILYAVDAQNGLTQFLADWSPSEKRPMYKRYILTSKDYGQIVELSMLVRARLKDTYNNNELTLFENSLGVMIAAQRVQAEANNDVNSATYKRQALSDILNNEGTYKQTAPQPMQFFRPLSGGAIKNIV